MTCQAFTLAEVLITLSVIGIVAALTMPALMANWQEKAFSTAKEVFDRRLEEATRQMNVKEALTGYTTTETFVDELKKYLKILQVCDTDPSSCFAPAITNGDGSETVETKDLKNSSDLNKGNWGTKALGVGLINGYTAILSYNPDCPVLDIGAAGAQTTSCLSLVYDINGKSKPNKLGKDIYTLNANPFDTCGGVKIGSLCVSTSNETYRSINTCDGSPYISYDSKGNANLYCSNNYWAGAKKACDDIGMHLPTESELNMLYQHKDELAMSGYFWSSVEYSTNNYYAWGQSFPDGSQDAHPKNSGINVRCVK
ncbi:MAG: prepilin-type N-terminal cleavage/methylation domain-containing protein [Heliobacteriaceae bacterium]|jgi:prepilin-type N-terminal cleavage/methylation domain-containing protein|nr:prepilin-type N-terminal cleavage/methylation domain-containing protein [Heliobacteriaceae bacterium]